MIYLILFFSCTIGAYDVVKATEHRSDRQNRHAFACEVVLMSSLEHLQDMVMLLLYMSEFTIVRYSREAICGAERSRNQHKILVKIGCFLWFGLVCFVCLRWCKHEIHRQMESS